jgi:predicted kinase
MSDHMTNPSRLIVVCGLSFAGKSTLANAICDEIGCKQVDVDVTKQDMFGTIAADSDLTSAQFAQIYAETDSRLATLLSVRARRETSHPWRHSWGVSR